MSRKSKAAQFADETYQIQVTGRHVNVTEAMKQYAIDKVAKIERFSDRVTDVLIIMDIQKIEHRCDIVMKVGHIKIKGHGSSNDMYVSIDQAVHKLESQLRRYKKRIRDHQTKALSLTDLKVNVLRRPEEDALEELNAEIEVTSEEDLIAKYRPHEIVAQKSRPLMTLTMDEATMKMELSQDAFLVFRSEEDLKLKVLYRREDDNFGLIELDT